MAQTVKHLPAMWETQVRTLGQEDPLEKGMAIHSSILTWRIPWAGIQSMAGYNPWGCKEWDMTVTNAYYLPNTFISYSGGAFCAPSSYSLVRWAGANETDLA